MSMLPWVKLPSGWIEGRGLKQFVWTEKKNDEGSAEAAALMVLMAIAHHASQQDGLARLPYERLRWATNLSKTKIADGLDILADRELVLRAPRGRSTLQLANFDPKGGWAMLPAGKLYGAKGIVFFNYLHLRKRTELDALKAYLAFAARRDTKANCAFITYAQLEDLAGIPEARIKPALSLLTVHHLVVVDQRESWSSEHGVSYSYRLSHLYPARHGGTTGRGDWVMGGLPHEDV